jgi:uncharacterized protein
MDWYALSVAGAGLFLAGIIKGATGLGYASCALPFLVIAVGLKPAMALIMIPAMATNVSLVMSTGHLQETFRRFAWLYGSIFPGIAVGLYLLTMINQQVAVKALGVVIVLYVAFTLAKPKLSLSQALERSLQVPTGLLNGIVTGLTGSQVMPLFPYMMALNLDPSRLVQAINVTAIMSSAVLLLGLTAAGIMTWPLFGWSIAAIVPALLGVALGTQVRDALPVAQFRQLVLIVLCAMGLSMLLR